MQIEFFVHFTTNFLKINKLSSHCSQHGQIEQKNCCSYYLYFFLSEEYLSMLKNGSNAFCFVFSNDIIMSVSL